LATMERDFQSCKSINAKMKRNSCIIKRLFGTEEALRKVFFIDLEKQEITKLSTGNKLSLILKGNKNNKYYEVLFNENNKRHYLKAHRLFFYWHHGFLPELLDHKDRNRLNNKIDNIRESTHSGNGRNSNKIKKKTSSKYKGVYYSKKYKKWVAKLTLNRKTIHIGHFDNEDDAGQAYNNKIRELGLEEVSVMNDTPQERARK